MPKHILAIDPGDLTGWCKMTLEGVVLEFDNLQPGEVYDRLNNYPDVEDLVAVIYEEFKVFRKKAHGQFTGNRMVTSQIIGAVCAFARGKGIIPHVQIPANKDIGAKWSGMAAPSNHSISHRVDAYNHGFYYLRNHYKISTSLEKRP